MGIELPLLPGSHARALALVEEPDAAFDDLANVVELDPALTAAVLRAANSAVSAPVGRIQSARDALVRVGMEQAKRIIVGAVLAGSTSGLRRATIDTTELWRHLVACALVADMAATNNVRRSAAFTAGLLHDLGRLAMAHSMPGEYANVVASVRVGVEPRTAERQVFGDDHAAIGAELARAWCLPDDIVEAIADHHDGDHGALAWVTWNGRQVSSHLGIGDGVEQAHPEAFDEDSDDAALVSALGGPEKLRQTVDWYRGAMVGAAA